jgi:hypothetical protein
VELSKYPQDLTEDELDLRFRLRVFAGLWEYRQFPDGQLVQPPVVARILSSCEIVVKTFALDGSIQFTHQRYGRLSLYSVTTGVGWQPASGPYKDAAMFLHQYEVGLEKLAADKSNAVFIPAAFTHRDV